MPNRPLPFMQVRIQTVLMVALLLPAQNALGQDTPDTDTGGDTDGPNIPFAQQSNDTESEPASSDEQETPQPSDAGDAISETSVSPDSDTTAVSNAPSAPSASPAGTATFSPGLGDEPPGASLTEAAPGQKSDSSPDDSAAETTSEKDTLFAMSLDELLGLRVTTASRRTSSQWTARISATASTGSA